MKPDIFKYVVDDLEESGRTSLEVIKVSLVTGFMFEGPWSFLDGNLEAIFIEHVDRVGHQAVRVQRKVYIDVESIVTVEAGQQQ
ncbi:hypothetical protein [Methylobacterium indicum]|uniref:Uncharacterized protein n=1 Tax=Methylobacterium indicum TaxID=1775910 RepID=A0A8H8X0N5_9HYPH|nr:hypothetical protein [Methylobacterium indicum]BCM87829.1 hypothetical protein mvi_62900 [Methylobacterium indicum]